MSDSSIWLDRYTKIAHCAFEISLFKAFGYAVKLDRSYVGTGNEPNHFVCSPLNGFALDQNDSPVKEIKSQDTLSAECGESLAQMCIDRGIKEFGVLSDTERMTEVSVSMSSHTSLRGMRQYRIDYDDYVYRFDVLGRA